MEMIPRSSVPYGDAIPDRIVPPMFTFILPLFRAAMGYMCYVLVIGYKLLVSRQGYYSEDGVVK